MTKRKVSKKKSTSKSVSVVKSSSKKKKFSLSTKILLGVAIVVLIIAALFLFFKLTGNAITGNATSTNIKDFFVVNSENLDNAIAKYIFFVIVLGIVWGALGFAQFPPQKFFQALIALGVSFLSVAYLAPEELLTALQSYTALGITLTFLVPFMIMIFISAMLVSSKEIANVSVPKLLLEQFLWIFYTVVLSYKVIVGIVSKQVPLELNVGMLVMVLILIISLAISVFNGKFRKYIWKLDNDIRKARLKAAGVTASEAVKIADQIGDTEKIADRRNNASKD